MATQLQIRRGTSAQVAAFTGAEGEIVVNTTNDSVHVNDGSSAGGFEMARVDGSNWAITNNISTTANISFGDNAKAIFGAGSDLEIFSDGTNGRISLNSASGNLRMLADEFQLANTGYTNLYLTTTAADAVRLFHGGNQKFETTSTGIDVTGTVTADGLTVDGESTVDAITYTANSSFPATGVSLNANGFSYEMAGTQGKIFRSASNTKALMQITNGGDISFYEDTGTTPKFFWDSSAESLGIGTTSPSELIVLDKSSGDTFVRFDKSGTFKGLVGVSDSSGSGSGSAVAGDVILRSQTRVLLDTGGTTRAVVDASGNVGIGTTSPNYSLTSYKAGANANYLQVVNGSSGPNAANGILYGLDGAGNGVINKQGAGDLITSVAGAERMRIDSSGNLLVGTTSTSASVAGGRIFSTGRLVTSVNGEGHYFRRNTSDGTIVEFAKDSTTVGSIGSVAGQTFIDLKPGSGGAGFRGGNAKIVPYVNSADADDTVDIGATAVRFKDIYATNGTIQTSDRNEKQDIEELSDAERRVAVAAKGLLRKFRWKSAVEEKGDEARIHFGIIAQDLQDAFTAEGLDAGRYGMFIHSTWTDEETGEERSRMGVRYSELLAFIIAAI